MVAQVIPPSKESSGTTVAVQVPESVTPAPAWPATDTCAVPFNAVMLWDAGAVSGVVTATLPDTLSCPVAERAKARKHRSATLFRTAYWYATTVPVMPVPPADHLIPPVI